MKPFFTVPPPRCRFCSLDIVLTDDLGSWRHIVTGLRSCIIPFSSELGNFDWCPGTIAEPNPRHVRLFLERAPYVQPSENRIY